MEKDRVKGYRTRLFDPGRHPLFNLISSPLKAILKAMTDKWRLVHDLSSPYDDTSVNSNIQMEPYHHHHFSTAMQLLIWLGPGAWFIAFDAVAAYKMPFLHPQDWHLNGEAVPGGFSFHTRPVFGSRSSGREWENIGSLAEFILRTAVQQGLPPSVAWALARYVDDYLAGFAPGAAGHAAALQACAIITQVCHDLGFPIDKCLGPRQSIRWLGLILNSVTMTAELTDVRRAFLTHLIESWTTRRSVSLKDIQRLQGHLIFATNVVDSGRFFTTSISSMLKTKRTQTIPIPNAVTLDLLWWLDLLRDPFWSGIRLLPSPTTGFITVWTDASKWGAGCYWTTSFMFWEWPAHIRQFAMSTATADDPTAENKHINMVYLELRAAVVLINTIGPANQGCAILIRSDNMPVVDSWQSKCSKSTACRPLFCTLTLLCQRFSITLTIEHIKGTDNIQADHLSRNNLNDFHLSISQCSVPAPSQIAPSLALTLHGQTTPGNV